MTKAKTRGSVNLRMVQMYKVREYLEPKLIESGYKTNLINITDDDLTFKISRFTQHTQVSLSRVRHRPLLIEIEADHEYGEKSKQKKPKNTNQNNSMDLWRYYWIFLIFGGVFGLAYFFRYILEFVTAFVSYLEAFQLTIPFLGVIAVLLILSLLFIPSYTSKKYIRLIEFEKDIIEDIQKYLTEYDKMLVDSDVVKCWSCFKDISINDKFCAFCQAEQK